MSEEGKSGSLKNRPFLGIYFRCCHVYWRIYKNRQGTAYEGRCPKCLREVKIGIDKEGISDRFFVAQ